MLYNYIYSHFVFILIANIIVKAIGSPIKQQTPFVVSLSNPNITSTPSFYINNVIYKNINQLEDFYGAIVNDIVNETVGEILDVAPGTFLTIHELQYIGKQYCRISLHTFMTTLKHYLDQHIRVSLPVSIKPLLKTYNQDNDILKLHRYMSQQMGAIINPSRLSHQIIQDVYSQNEENYSNPMAIIWKIISSRQWHLTHDHESNESKSLESWLNSWLADIENILWVHFQRKSVVQL